MRFLLDTHALVWFAGGDARRISPRVREAILEPSAQVFVSAVSAMEITTKHRLGKLPEAELLARNFRAEIATDGFIELNISVEHAERAGRLAIPHKDPFDRLLIAQAIIENLVLVSNEPLFDSFGVNRLW